MFKLRYDQNRKKDIAAAALIFRSISGAANLSPPLFCTKAYSTVGASTLPPTECLSKKVSRQGHLSLFVIPPERAKVGVTHTCCHLPQKGSWSAPNPTLLFGKIKQNHTKQVENPVHNVLCLTWEELPCLRRSHAGMPSKQKCPQTLLKIQRALEVVMANSTLRLDCAPIARGRYRPVCEMDRVAWMIET